VVPVEGLEPTLS